MKNVFFILLICFIASCDDDNCDNNILVEILRSESNYFGLWMNSIIRENSDYSKSYNWSLVQNLKMASEFESSSIKSAKNEIISGNILDDHSVKDFIDILVYRDSVVWSGFIFAIEHEYENYGFSKKESTEIVELSVLEYKNLVNYSKIINVNGRGHTNKNNQINILGISRIRENYFLNFYMKYFNSTSFNENYFVPIIVPERTCYSIGEYFRAYISIGSYSTTLNPDNVIILVNNDTLDLDDSGRANFSEKVTSTDERNLKIKCLIINTAEGISFEGESNFTYDVKE